MNSVAESSLRARHQLVVDVELVLHALGLGDPLDEQHLLHLEAQRLAVLEHERHRGPHRHAPRALVGDHRAAERVAHAAVRGERDDLLARERPHSAGSP
jgi:hypothetical protein